MRNQVEGAQFRRDVKLAHKRNKDVSKLREGILLLIEGNPLPPRYKDHPLGGDWKHFRDRHIEPDWLLIYQIDGQDLHLVRTETHSERVRFAAPDFPPSYRPPQVPETPTNPALRL